MKTTWLTILCWTYIRLSTSFPVDDRPAFTPWDLAKREIEAAIFSNPLGPQFGVPDETCRGTLEGPNTGSCWKMADVTVDKFIANRKPEANECEVPCLFYTSKLTGAAERLANFVLKEVLLTGAAEGPRKYQTIWELHPPKFYPNKNDLDKTPEAKCIYQDQRDQDYDANFDGCQRLYFKSMSKAMAMECKGEVFLMTNSDLSGTRPEGKKEKVPVDGIWWQVEFPTLIDDARPADKKITKVSTEPRRRYQFMDV
ncbi:hypothetical protein J4E83_003222 [Alternaria metachromatica]|uniref:uncharacterized protein n=1 Tax=Alternaria metachromatica TaxID=283354 RepID=UPI0020C22194|nr:uncharacterized protein J4E83_003222 [Alternaria metachromatica]KAI4628669.1 hypothetical protein J4E83_003222 [Alternaria metachromatica]